MELFSLIMIAFGLLSAIGLKMIIESLKRYDEKKDFNPFKPVILICIGLKILFEHLLA